MTTIADLEKSLPWGLHDAHLESVHIDWAAARLTLNVRVALGKHQEEDRRAKIVVEGLVFCAVDPPQIDRSNGYEPTPQTGLRIDSGEGAAGHAKDALPVTPTDCFLTYFFVSNWNSFIHVCGRNASLEWQEPNAVPSRSTARAMFAGDEVPDPLKR